MTDLEKAIIKYRKDERGWAWIAKKLGLKSRQHAFAIGKSLINQGKVIHFLTIYGGKKKE